MKTCVKCRRMDLVVVNYNDSIGNLPYCCYREAIICKDIYNCRFFKKNKINKIYKKIKSKTIYIKRGE